MRRFLLLGGLVGLGTGLVGFARPIGWALVTYGIRSKYPEVPHLSTRELATQLALGAAPLFLDVRTEAEYEVSHLHGALRIAPDAHTFPALADLPRDMPIVVYCSVGYRSAALAPRLREAGFTNVANLRGSIFRWANEGRPLVRAGAPTHEVHPYNRRWGRLLRASVRAEAPDVHN